MVKGKFKASGSGWGEIVVLIKYWKKQLLLWALDVEDGN